MLEIVLTIDSCGHQVSIAEIDSIGSFSSTILQGNLSPGNVGYVLGDNVSPLLVQILPGVFMGPACEEPIGQMPGHRRLTRRLGPGYYDLLVEVWSDRSR